jgi:predicted Zn-ribbon and HTH transcriptional regulator
MNMDKLICKRCYHDWVPRTDNPTQCPRCKSPYWNKERVRGVEV